LVEVQCEYVTHFEKHNEHCLRGLLQRFEGVGFDAPDVRAVPLYDLSHEPAERRFTNQ